MRNRDLLEGMRRDLDVWIKFPERPPGNYINFKYFSFYKSVELDINTNFIRFKLIFFLYSVLINRRSI